jgi:hypothetical protein
MGFRLRFSQQNQSISGDIAAIDPDYDYDNYNLTYSSYTMISHRTTMFPIFGTTIFVTRLPKAARHI